MGMGYAHLLGKMAKAVRQRSRLAIMIITVRFIYFPFVMLKPTPGGPLTLFANPGGV